MSGADVMGAGTRSDSVELRAVGPLTVGGPGERVLLTSAVIPPAPGDWEGVILAGSKPTDFQNFEIAYAVHGMAGRTHSAAAFLDGIIRNASEQGVAILHGSSGLYEDLTVRDNLGGGMSFATTSGEIEIRRNRVLRNGAYGVRLSGAEVKMTSNLVAGSPIGIDVIAGGLSRVLHNTISDTTEACLQSDDGYLWFYHNSLSWCGEAGVVSDYSTEWGQAEANNVFASGESSAYFNQNVTYSTLDPQFEDRDPSGQMRWHDYRLLPGSALVGAGTDKYAFTETDAAGEPRQHGLLDLGAYEYQPEAPRDPVAQLTGPELFPMLDEVCFDASGTVDPDGDAMAFQWTFPGDVTETGAQACHVFTANGIQEVIVLATDTTGREDHAVLYVESNHRPIADAGAEVYAGAGADAANFDGSSTSDPDGQVVTWSWDLGEGHHSTKVKPSQQYAAGPTRDVLVTLTVTDDDGHTDTDTTIAHVIGAEDTVGPLIAHTPPPDGHAGGQPLALKAIISDFAGIQAAEIHYRAVGSSAFSSLPLVAGAEKEYTVEVPAAAVMASGLEYYFAAEDKLGNASASPASAPATLHTVAVGPADTEPPVIDHTPIAGAPPGAAIGIQASVSDDTAVSAVTLHHRQVGAPEYTMLPMFGGSSAWEGTIPAESVAAPGVEYYLTASDVAGNGASAPEGAPAAVFTIAVEAVDDQGPFLSGPPEPKLVADADWWVEVSAADESSVVSVTLHYRMVGQSWTAVELSSSGSGTWSGVVPGAALQVGTLEYYVSAVDGAPGANESTWPAGGSGAPATAPVAGSDVTPPELAHTPLAEAQLEGAPVLVHCQASDDSGVASVSLHHRPASGTWASIEMAPFGDHWVAQLPGSAVAAPEVEYYLAATDGSPSANEALLPAGGESDPFVMAVGDVDHAPPQIVWGPLPGSVPPGVAVTVEAMVVDASGLTEVALHHRPDEGSAASTVEMVAGPSDDVYTATLPGGAAVPPTLLLRISAVDGASPPNQASTGERSVPITVDELGPEIAHVPVTGLVDVSQPVPTTATITDISGLSGASVHYRAAGAAWSEAPLVFDGSVWAAEIPEGSLVVGTVEYFLSATDASPQANESTFPPAGESGPLTFIAVAPDDAPPAVALVDLPAVAAPGSPVQISAVASDPGGIAGVSLHYRGNGGSWQVQPMSAGDTWSAQIPGAAVSPPSVELYVSATDTAGNVGYAPAGAPSATATVNVEESDTTGPTIQHEPAPSWPALTDKTIEAVITDASGVSAVTLHWAPAGTESWSQLSMTSTSSSTWTATVPAQAVTPPGLRYWLEATDASDPPNVAQAPDTWWEVAVTAEDADGPSIDHTPLGSGLSQPVSIEAWITDDSGVASAAVLIRKSGAVSFDSLDLELVGADEYAVTVPASLVSPPGFEYYLLAEDGVGNFSTAPAEGYLAPYVVSIVGGDLVGPEIAHAPPASAPAYEPVTLSVTALDESGLDEVAVYFAPAGDTSTFEVLHLVEVGPNLWEGAIPGADVTPPGVSYHVTAIDGATPPNASRSPAGAPAKLHTIAVTEPTGDDVAAPGADASGTGDVSSTSPDASSGGGGSSGGSGCQASPTGAPATGSLLLLLAIASLMRRRKERPERLPRS